MWRRRGDLSVAEAAAQIGVTVYRWRALEAGGAALEAGCAAAGIAVGRLTPNEAATVQRRRAGLTVADVADQMGLSAWWVTQMERGSAPCDRLLEFWLRRG